MLKYTEFWWFFLKENEINTAVLSTCVYCRQLRAQVPIVPGPATHRRVWNSRHVLAEWGSFIMDTQNQYSCIFLLFLMSKIVFVTPTFSVCLLKLWKLSNYRLLDVLLYNTGYIWTSTQLDKSHNGSFNMTFQAVYSLKYISVLYSKTFNNL